MRKALFPLVLLLLGAGLAAATLAKSQPRAAPQDPPPLPGSSARPGGLVVHEWGTFTGFAGSNGVQLDFRPLVDSDLPEFVYDRARQAGYVGEWLGKQFIYSRQRMETPVIYFYTDEPRTVDVRVDFPQGLLTEFYPPVHRMAPRFKPNKPEPVGKSSLVWNDVELLPASADGRLPAAEHAPPAAAGDNHYVLARETQSALLRTRDPRQRDVSHYEKFLFYRGVGNFQLPLAVRAGGGGRFVVENAGSEPVKSLFLVSVAEGQVRFARHHVLGSGGRVELVQAVAGSSADVLADALAAALQAEGLYADEARSMVRTWQQSWFGEEGDRLFYIVPPRATQRVLPLEIDPPPDELVRVLVGRLEVLTPERESRLIEVLEDLSDENAERRALAKQALGQFARFAEPALSRAAELSAAPQPAAAAQP